MEEYLINNNKENLTEVLIRHFTRSHYQEVYTQSPLLQFIYTTMKDLIINEDIQDFITLYSISLLTESCLNRDSSYIAYNGHNNAVAVSERNIAEMIFSLNINQNLKKDIIKNNLVRKSLQRLLREGFVEVDRHFSNNREYYFILINSTLYAELGGAQIELHQAILDFIEKGFLLIMNTGLYIEAVISYAEGWEILRNEFPMEYEDIVIGLRKWNLLKQYSYLENIFLKTQPNDVAIRYRKVQHNRGKISLDIVQDSKYNIIEALMLEYPMLVKRENTRLYVIIVPLYTRRNQFSDILRDINDINRDFHSYPFVVLGVNTRETDEGQINVINIVKQNDNQSSNADIKEMLLKILSKQDKSISLTETLDQKLEEQTEIIINAMDEWEKKLTEEINKKYTLNIEEGKLSFREALIKISPKNGERVFNLINNLENSDKNTRKLSLHRVRDYFYTAESLYRKIYSREEDAKIDHRLELSFLCVEYIKGMETFLVDRISQLIQSNTVNKALLDYTDRNGRINTNLERYECGPLLYFLDRNKEILIKDRVRWGSLEWGTIETNPRKRGFLQPNSFAVYMVDQWTKEVRNGKMHKDPVYLNASQENSIDHVRLETLKALITLYEIMIE